MVPNIHNQERLAFDHRSQLLREADHERKLAALPQQQVSLMRVIVGKLGALLVTLGSSMQQPGQRRQPVLNDLSSLQ